MIFAPLFLVLAWAIHPRQPGDQTRNNLAYAMWWLGLAIDIAIIAAII